MVDFVESFTIARHRYGIEELDAGGFQCWQNGSRLSARIPLLSTARKAIHSHAVSQLRAEAAGFRERALACDMRLNSLGTDHSCLARFQNIEDKADG